MNKEQLARRLEIEGFIKAFYVLDGPPDWDGFHLHSLGARWLVDYYDHGQRQAIGDYATEHEACECLYRELAADPGARWPRSGKPEDPTQDEPRR